MSHKHIDSGNGVCVGVALQCHCCQRLLLILVFGFQLIIPSLMPTTHAHTPSKLRRSFASSIARSLQVFLHLRGMRLTAPQPPANSIDATHLRLRYVHLSFITCAARPAHTDTIGPTLANSCVLTAARYTLTKTLNGID